MCVPTSHSQTERSAYFKYAVETLGMLNQSYRVGGACPNFVEKTFADGFGTVKFVNIFSLESFAIIIVNYI